MSISKEACKEPVIFEKITPHTLRHPFATRAFERGLKPKNVQVLLGHGSLSMTMDLYTHVTEDVKVEEMKKWKAGIVERPENTGSFCLPKCKVPCRM